MRIGNIVLKDKRNHLEVVSEEDFSHKIQAEANEKGQFKGKDNCWICEGWSEMQFEFRSNIIGGQVFIHFEFDDFKPDPLP